MHSISDRYVSRTANSLGFRVVIACLLVCLYQCEGSPVNTQNNVATWVLMNKRGNLTITPACDMVSARIPSNGRTRLANRHPDFTEPPYIGDTELFYLWSGGGDLTEFYVDQQVWLLQRKSSTSYEWDILNPDSDPATWPTARTGSMGFASSRGDLVIFGGQSTNQNTNRYEFNDDIQLFNLTDLQWHTVVKRSDHALMNRGPVGKADGVITLIPGVSPSGYHRYWLHGGRGSLDGLYTGKLSQDLHDNMRLTFGYRHDGSIDFSWHPLDNITICVEYHLHCSDSISVERQAPGIVDLLIAMLNMTSEHSRPAGFIDTWTKFESYSSTVQNVASSLLNEFEMTHPTNNNSNCRERCWAFEWSRAPNFPGKGEGVTAAVVGDKYYVFGGYNCTERGVSSMGGLKCYHNSLYIYDLKLGKWIARLQPPKKPFKNQMEAEQFALWPHKRAYHSMVVVDGKLWITGGAYQDGFGVYTFYNDVHVFNTTSLLWENVTVYGTPPAPRYKANIQFVEQFDEIWYYMGCSSNQWFNDVYVLLVGKLITAENIQATGSGTKEAHAGKITRFYLQTRETHRNVNGSYVFGPSIRWGGGLAGDIEVRCLGDGSDTYKVLTLDEGIVVDMDNGWYEVTYNVSVGTKLALHIEFGNKPIPGSPFTVNLIPSQPAALYSYAYQYEVALLAGESSLYLQLEDRFRNTITTGSHDGNITLGYLPMSTTLITMGTDGRGVLTQNDVQFIPLAAEIDDFGNGTYGITYDSPNIDNFWLSIGYDGSMAGDAPYAVLAMQGFFISNVAITVIRAFTIMSLVFCVVFALAVFFLRHEVALKAATPLFLQFMLVGAALSLCSIFFLSIKTDYGCRAFATLLSVGMVTLLGSLYIKTYRLMVIFRQKNLRVIRITLTQMTTVLVGMVSTALLYNALWLSISPARAMVQPSSTYPLTYLECGGDNFNIWSGIQYVLQGLFLFYGVFLAVMTRKLPSAYNEATYLGFSTYNIAVSSCLTLPIVYLTSTEDTLSAMYVLTSLVIIWGVDFTMFMLILPRLYFIYKKIAPDQRFLEEMGFRRSRGVYSPRGGGDKRTNSPSPRSGDQDTLSAGSAGSAGGGMTPGTSTKAGAGTGTHSSKTKSTRSNKQPQTPTDSSMLKQRLLDDGDGDRDRVRDDKEDDENGPGLVEIHASLYTGDHSDEMEDEQEMTSSRHRFHKDHGTTTIHRNQKVSSSSLEPSNGRDESRTVDGDSGTYKPPQLSQEPSV